jgi:hypothetical protein
MEILLGALCLAGLLVPVALALLPSQRRRMSRR